MNYFQTYLRSILFQEETKVTSKWRPCKAKFEPKQDKAPNKVQPKQGGGIENEIKAEVATSLIRMIQQFERQKVSQVQELIHQPLNAQLSNNNMDWDIALEQFQRFGIPKFVGNPDPEQVEILLKNMANIFAALKYPEKSHVSFIVFQFEGTTWSWWKMIWSKQDRESTTWDWMNFTKEFNEKCILLIIQEEWEDVFMSFRQGVRSVEEYEAQFIGSRNLPLIQCRQSKSEIGDFFKA